MPQDTRRGYVPGDVRDFNEEALDRMKRAREDILYLIDRGYGPEGALTFVGNHFQFSSRQRLALLRALCGSVALQGRKSRMITLGPEGEGPGTKAGEALREGLRIDGFNVIITLEAARFCR
jgi:hypothetical protein